MASMSASQFKANVPTSGRDRFAVPRLPKCNSMLFLLACYVIRWLPLRFGFWLVHLRSLFVITAERFVDQISLHIRANFQTHYGSVFFLFAIRASPPHV